jgi:hypothetical protein
MRTIEARSQAGFTYLWVLMSVAFMGLGLMVTADLHSTSARRQQETDLLWVGQQFQMALASYHNVTLPNGAREYPVSVDDLLEDKRGVVVRRHLRKLLVDPVTGRAEWGEVRVGGRIVGFHSLSDAVPIKQRGFDEQFMQFKGKQRISEWIFVGL